MVGGLDADIFQVSSLYPQAAVCWAISIKKRMGGCSKTTI